MGKGSGRCFTSCYNFAWRAVLRCCCLLNTSLCLAHACVEVPIFGKLSPLTTFKYRTYERLIIPSIEKSHTLRISTDKDYDKDHRGGTFIWGNSRSFFSNLPG